MRFVLVGLDLAGEVLELVELVHFWFRHRYDLQVPGFIPDQPFSFFMDESGISNHRFTVVGAICLRSAVINQVHDSIQAFREKHNMSSELKWSKVSDQKSIEYRALVDYFFAMNNLNILQFHAIVFDNHGANHSRYNEGDQDVGLSKLY